MAAIRSKFESNKKKNEDMISELPINIQCHILSFLSTQDAVKTCILATNWRYLWTYLSTLDIQMLSFNQKCQIDYSRRVPLPKLSLLFAKTHLSSIALPSSFPFLYTLTLSYATFPNNNSLPLFISRCPLLQNLTLDYCYLFYTQNITISSSTLTHLTIRLNRHCVNPHNISNYSFQIDAVNLLSLTYISHPIVQFRFVNPPTSSLLNAYIDFGIDFWLSELKHDCSCISLLFTGLAGSVKSLTLAKDIMKFPLIYGACRSHNHLNFLLLPEFPNLTHLCLDNMTLYSRVNFMEFLGRCPKLEVLTFPASKRDKPIHGASIRIPPCLKILHISNFDGVGHEFIKLILQNARVLEEIQISCLPSAHPDNYNMEDIKDQFVGIASCVIKFL